MKIHIIALFYLAASSAPALAAPQSPLTNKAGQIVSMTTGDTLQAPPAVSSAASVNLPHGTPPTLPTDGDVWTTTSGIYARINGAIIGPLAQQPFTQSGAGAQPISRDALLKQSLNVTQFIPASNSGAWGDGVIDDGPMIRAAYTECVRLGFRAIYLPQPPVAYYVKSLDSSGLGGIVVGDGAHANSCAFVGEADNSWGDYNGGVNIKLGAGLNRPLIYVQANAASASLYHLRLDGNKAAQVGWSGGPGGKLYTVQVADGPAVPEGSIRAEDSWIINGYNGNLYIGSGRGATWTKNLWLQYSGQGSGDYALYLNGYDGTFLNMQVGPNTGGGIQVAEGSQYQWLGGAVFLNGYDGIDINGDKVNYLNATSVNFQGNGCNGVTDTGSAPFSGTQAVGHFFIQPTFDGNSATTTNMCSDVYANGSTRINLVAPAFIGNEITGGKMPKYNIQTSGNSLVRLANPGFSAIANATAVANNYKQIYCEGCNWQNSWTPSVAGSSTAGTLTYSSRVGTWSRHNNEVTVHFALQWTAFSGATGALTVTGLPYYASTGTMPGTCTFNNVHGWTGQASASVLTGLAGSGSTTLYVYEYGRALNATQASVSEFGNAGLLQGTCVYDTDN